jgi:dynein heavy chain
MSKKWPLCIDPQHIANSFIKKLCSDKNKELFKVVNPGDDKLQFELEASIKFGKMLLLENLGDTLPVEFDKVLAPTFRHRGKSRMLKFSEKEIEYHNDFKL